MEPTLLISHLTSFSPNLLFFAQTWCENVDHIFKKSTSGIDSNKELIPRYSNSNSLGSDSNSDSGKKWNHNTSS